MSTAMTKIHKITGGLKGTIFADVRASLVVFLVAVPLSLGIAVASGVPPALGLITAIVGGIVVGALPGSTFQVSGPAAGLTVLVYELVADHGIGLLGPVVLLAGAIQMGMVFLKLGHWFRAISLPVVQGMLAGIGVLIILSQVYVLVDESPRDNGVQDLLFLPDLFVEGLVPEASGIGSHNIAAFLGLLTIAVLFAWGRVPKRLRIIPAPLVGVTLASVLAAVLQLPVKHVAVPANLLDEVSLPSLDSLAGAGVGTVLAGAMAFALIASAETLLSATALDRMRPDQRTDYNRELLAQGVGNSIVGFLGALPMTGVIVRSSTNVEAGARTRLSPVLHGVWILAFVALLPSVLELIPLASLAGVLIHAGLKLVKPDAIRALLKFGRAEAGIYFGTVIAIVLTNLLEGVLIGLGLAVIKLLHTFSRLDSNVEHEGEGAGSTVVLDGSATFLQLPKLAAALESIGPGADVRLKLDGLDFIDPACRALVDNWTTQHKLTGGHLVIEQDGHEILWRTGELADSQGRVLDSETLAAAETSLLRKEAEEAAADGDDGPRVNQG